MTRGGYREGAGRPFGARDVSPRKSARLDRLKSMSEEYDTNEYLITNERRVFAGNALELMTVMYKAEQLPVRVRLYAASKAVEFECDKSGRTLEQIREEVRRELIEANNDDGWKEKLEADVKRIRAIIIEQRDQQLKAWVGAGILSQEAAQKVRSLWAEAADRPFHIEDFAMPDGARTWDRYDADRIGPLPVVVRKRESSSIEHENGAATNCLSGEHGPENRQEASVSLVGAPTLYDNPGLQSPPDEPEILVPTRRPGGGIHFVALKR